jgi:hypothetical protein
MNARRLILAIVVSLCSTFGALAFAAVPALAAGAPIVEAETTNLPPFLFFHSITADNAALSARINPNNEETTYEFEYSTEGTVGSPGTLEGTIVKVPGGSVPAGSETQTAGPVYLGEALMPATTYYYRVLATNASGTEAGPVESFTTLVAPVVTAASATGVTRTTATLGGGSVNALGVETSYRYAYADAEEYRRGLEESPSDPYVYGRGTPEVAIGSENAVEATEPVVVEGLTPGAEYHYAVIASNNEGTVVVGPGRAFTTAAPLAPPTLGASSVSNVTQSGATIGGSIDAQGLPTRWELELGSAPGELLYQAAGRSESAESEPIAVGVENLAPGTTYYYRFIAIDPSAPVNPDTQQQEPAETPEGSFTTAPGPPPPALAGVPVFTVIAHAPYTFPTEAASGTPLPKQAAKCAKGKKRGSHGKCVKSKSKTTHKAKKSAHTDRRARQ